MALVNEVATGKALGCTGCTGWVGRGFECVVVIVVVVVVVVLVVVIIPGNKLLRCPLEDGWVGTMVVMTVGWEYSYWLLIAWEEVEGEIER